MRTIVLFLAALLLGGCAAKVGAPAPTTNGVPTTYTEAWCRENPATAAETSFVVYGPLDPTATTRVLVKRVSGINQTTPAAVARTASITQTRYSAGGITLTVSRLSSSSSSDQFDGTATETGGASYTLLCRSSVTSP